MIVAFSSSSPLASVAILSRDGKVLGSGSREAPMAAGQACVELLQQILGETDLDISDAGLFVADVGPGSFTGTRVCVTLAKTLAYAYSRPAAGVSAFDLVSPERAVVIPARKGHYFLRIPGAAPTIVQAAPGDAVGYGSTLGAQAFPIAENVRALMAGLRPAPCAELLPEYLLEPSISQPRVPYGNLGVPGG